MKSESVFIPLALSQLDGDASFTAPSQNFLYPPLSQFSISSRASPRSTMAESINVGVFITETDQGSFSLGNSKSTKPQTPARIPATHEQLKAKPRYWHHEFHRILEEEVKLIHHQQSIRLKAQKAPQPVTESAVGSPLTRVSSAQGVTASFSSSTPDVEDGPGAGSASRGGNVLVGEPLMISGPTALTAHLLSVNPIPLTFHASVLAGAYKPSVAVPRVMSVRMVRFITEFEEACVAGALEVLKVIAPMWDSSVMVGSGFDSRNSSRQGKKPQGLEDAGSMRKRGGLNSKEGGPIPIDDTKNFFVYKNMIFNVLHLLDEATLRTVGCVENATKAAAAEVRGLEAIINLACVKGSLTLRGHPKPPVAGTGAVTSTAATGGEAVRGEASEQHATAISVPLVSLVKVHGISMFVVAQPALTPVESVVSGATDPTIMHVPKAAEHRTLMTTLSSLLRVPHASGYVDSQHQRRFPDAPLAGHPDCTVVLAKKLLKVDEDVAPAAVKQATPLNTPFIPRWKPEEDDDESVTEVAIKYSEVFAQVGDRHLVDVLIVQNVAKLVSPLADVSQSTLLPHIVSSSPRPKLLGTPSSESPSDRNALTPMTPSRRASDKVQMTVIVGKSPQPVKSNDKDGGLSASSSALVIPNPPSHNQIFASVAQSALRSRYFQMSTGASLFQLLHPNYVLTLPWDWDVQRHGMTKQAAAASSSTDDLSHTSGEVNSVTATHHLLHDHMDHLIEWLFHLVDTVPSIGAFITDFDGSCLKEILHQWGVNLRYLGTLHRKLCDALVVKAPNAVASTISILQAWNAPSSNNTLPHSVSSKGLHGPGKQSSSTKGKGSTVNPSSTRKEGAAYQGTSSQGAAAQGKDAAGQQPTPATTNIQVGLQGGKMYVDRSVRLDMAALQDISLSISGTLTSLSGMLSTDLTANLSPQPQPVSHNPVNATSTLPLISPRRLTNTSSDIGAILTPQAMPLTHTQHRDAAGPLSHPVGGASAVNDSSCVRSPLHRSPIEHLLIVIRCEMIARAFRDVFTEHTKALVLRSIPVKEKFDLSKGDVDKSAANQRKSMFQMESKLPILSFLPEDTSPAMTTLLQSPGKGGHLLTPGDGALMTPSAPKENPIDKLPTSTRLYLKLKELSSVLDERDATRGHSGDEGLTTRSIDLLGALSAREATHSGGTTSVREDPNVAFESNNALLAITPVNEEKTKIALLVEAVLQNGTTPFSAQFWSHVMLSELWVKFGSYSGGGGGTGISSKRSDIQKTDIYMLLQRISAHCGLQWSDSFKSQLAALGPLDHLAARKALAIPVCHKSIASVRPLLRSTLRVPFLEESVKLMVGKTRSALSPATVRDQPTVTAVTRVINYLSLEAPTQDLYDSKITQLESMLNKIQMKRFNVKKYKEGLGDEVSAQEMELLEALSRLYRFGGSKKLAELQLCLAQKSNVEIVLFYQRVRKLWSAIGFDGICYIPCGVCGVLFNATINDIHKCGQGHSASMKIDREVLAVGIADGKLPSGMISASSSIPGYEPRYARKCVASSCWRPEPGAHEPWIQFDFATSREIVAIEITGDGVDKFVGSLRLEYHIADIKKTCVFTGEYVRREGNGPGETMMCHALGDDKQQSGSFPSRGGHKGGAIRHVSRSGLIRHSSNSSTSSQLGQDGLISPGSNTFDIASPSFAMGASIGQSVRGVMSSSKGMASSTVKNNISSFEESKTDVKLQRTPTPPPSLPLYGKHGDAQRPTFLLANTDASSLVRIQIVDPFRCSSLRVVVGNEDCATAAIKVEIFYNSRHTPDPARGGTTERIAANHINWTSPIMMSVATGAGNRRGSIAHLSNSKTSRRELAEKEHQLLKQIAEIEKSIVISSNVEAAMPPTGDNKVAKGAAGAIPPPPLPYEMLISRTSSELPYLWNQVLQLLLQWGIERCTDVQVAQFNLLRFYIAEVKWYAKLGQLQKAASKADRLMEKLDDAVGPLGFGSIALLVGPLMELIRDALGCAGVLGQHLHDFFHIVDWAAEVRHPLTVQLVAVLIDASTFGTQDDRQRVVEVCQKLAEDGRLKGITDVISDHGSPTRRYASPSSPVRHASPAASPSRNDVNFSPVVKSVFDKLRARVSFLKMEGSSHLYPDDPEGVKSLEFEAALLEDRLKR